MVQTKFLINLIVIIDIVTEFRFTIGFLCKDPTNPLNLVEYREDRVCCNSILHRKLDFQGRERDCCDNQLFYLDTCACNSSSQLESLDSGPLDSCLVPISKPSQPDITTMSPSSSKVPANVHNERYQKFDHMYCTHAETCFDPSREICCPDGVYNRRIVCPSLEINYKFCTDNERLERDVCAKEYKHVYHISLIEMIIQDSSYQMFNATVSEIMMSERSSKRFVKLKINVLHLCPYSLTGKTFTVFSAKKHNWNAASYFYLYEDDLVLSKKIRHKHLSNVSEKCKKSTKTNSMNTGINSVSNAGDTQICCALSSVALQFIFSLGVHFVLNIPLYR